MSNEVKVINPEDYGIEKENANGLVGNLPNITSERDVMVLEYDKIIKMDIDDSETVSLARELRKKIQKNRTQGINIWHKTTKDYFLKGGQFVDALKRKEIAVNERMEANLLEIEKHEENKEKERLEKLQSSRVLLISDYVDDANERDFLKFSESEFNDLLNIKKKEKADRIAAEKKAEDERIAKEKKEAEEREVQRLENIRLKAEAEAREKKIEEERKERERLAKIESDKQKAIQDKLKAEAEAQLKKENEAREKAELEAKKAKEKADRLIKENKAREEAAKIEASRLAKEEAARLKAAAQAPDKEKLKSAIELVRASFEPLNVADSEVKAVAKEIELKLIGWYNWANKEIDNLK